METEELVGDATLDDWIEHVIGCECSAAVEGFDPMGAFVGETFSRDAGFSEHEEHFAFLFEGEDRILFAGQLPVQHGWRVCGDLSSDPGCKGREAFRIIHLHVADRQRVPCGNGSLASLKDGGS